MPGSTRPTSATRLRPGSELTPRLLVTLAAVAVLALLLLAGKYHFDFEPTWRHRGLLLEGLGRTALATALGYSLGLVLGLFVALARLSRRTVIRHVGDLYVEVVRGTPFLVQLMIWYFVVAPLLRVDSLVAVGAFALGVLGAAYIGEIIRAGIESIDRGQFEASRSLGMTRAQTLRHVIVPQAVRRMIPPLTSELIALTKESSLLFAIGYVELMNAGRQIGASTYKYLEPLLVVACLYLMITIPLSLLSRRLERRLGKSARSAVAL